MKVRLELDGELFDVEVRRTKDGLVIACDGEELPAEARQGPAGIEVRMGGESRVVGFPGPGETTIAGRLHAYRVAGFEPGGDEAGPGSGGLVAVRSQMPGRLVKVLVEPGAEVAKGSPLLVLEAMKMQNELASPAAGRVVEVLAKAGDLVEFGRVLLRLEPGHKS